jgi:hypothetical protein
MNTPQPLKRRLGSLRNEIGIVWIERITESRFVIALEISNLLALIQPTVAIDHAAGAVGERCYDLFEALKQCDVPGLNDMSPVAAARAAALLAVDDLEQTLRSASPSARAVALALEWPGTH